MKRTFDLSGPVSCLYSYLTQQGGCGYQKLEFNCYIGIPTPKT